MDAALRLGASVVGLAAIANAGMHLVLLLAAPGDLLAWGMLALSAVCVTCAVRVLRGPRAVGPWLMVATMAVAMLGLHLVVSSGVASGGHGSHLHPIGEPGAATALAPALLTTSLLCIGEFLVAAVALGVIRRRSPVRGPVLRPS